MATPIFTEEEVSAFKERLKEIENDKLTFPDYKSRENAKSVVNNAFFAQTASRILKNRVDDFINYLLIIVGSKGERGEIPVWQGFSHADNEAYLNILQGYENPLNRRYLHMFLKAILVAHRNWALTAFVKFLRGNKVAGGKADKLEGFGYFHKDSGWNEAQVKSVALILFDEYSAVSKIFMKYDSQLADRVYEESENNWDIPYSAQFAATSKTVNEDLIKALSRIAHGKAYLTGPDYSCFDHDRKCLEGASYQGQWEEGVQAQKGAYRYPYDYIGLL